MPQSKVLFLIFLAPYVCTTYEAALHKHDMLCSGWFTLCNNSGLVPTLYELMQIKSWSYVHVLQDSIQFSHDGPTI